MVITFDELTALRVKYLDKKIVLGSGVFDLIHVGHLKYLQLLGNYGDIVVVMIKGDERVRLNKHPTRPIIPEQDRVAMVDAMKGVDYAFIGPYDHDAPAVVDYTYEKVFKALQPDVFVTSNGAWDKLQAISSAEIIVLPREQKGRHASTTAIVEHVQGLSKN